MTFTGRRLIAITLLVLASAGSGSAQLADQKVLSLERAKKVAAAAAADARQRNEGAAIAIVDDLDFYKVPEPGENVGEVVRLAPALDAIVPSPPRLEKVAGGFLFTEGPVWVRDGGYLLFSDPNDNRIYRWTPDGELSVFRTKSGYTGADIAEYGQPGSNGLTLDREFAAREDHGVTVSDIVALDHFRERLRKTR